MITARAIMSENVITINQTATITEAANMMLDKHVSSLLVTENDKPIATVTENDLVKGAIKPNVKRVKVKDIMGKKFLNISPKTTYDYIAKKMKEEKIKKFPIIENDRLVGIITETDILDATRDFTRFHQIMQEVILVVFGLVTAFVLFFFSPLGQSVFGG